MEYKACFFNNNSIIEKINLSSKTEMGAFAETKRLAKKFNNKAIGICLAKIYGGKIYYAHYDLDKKYRFLTWEIAQ